MLLISFCDAETFLNTKFLHQKAYHITVQYVAWITKGNQLWQLLATSLGAERPHDSGWQGGAPWTPAWKRFQPSVSKSTSKSYLLTLPVPLLLFR